MPARLKLPMPVMTDEERAAIDRRVPKSAAYRGEEHEFQKSLFKEMKLRSGWEPRLELLFAIPNAAKRSLAVAARMKAEGMKSGVSDVFLAVASQGKHGMWQELKSATGSPTAEQWTWLLAMHRGGYAAHLVNDIQTARDLFLSYLDTP